MRVAELVEGVWSQPDSPKKVKALKKIVKHKMPAASASKLLFNIIGNDELHNELEVLADQNPEACVRDHVMKYIRHTYPEVFQQIAKHKDYNNSDQPEDEMIGDYGEYAPLGHEGKTPT